MPLKFLFPEQNHLPLTMSKTRIFHDIPFIGDKATQFDSIPNNTINIPTIGHEATLLVVSLSMVPRPADPIGACVDDL